jgi:AcrR family transcriptional regulator
MRILDETFRLVSMASTRQTLGPPPASRRSERARRAILEAADDLLVENGFANLTIEAIAARAGVGKQTIYRWWPSKAAVLMDALGEDLVEHLTPADRDGVEAAIREHLGALARFLAVSEAGAVYCALVGQAQHDPEMASTFRNEYLRPLRERELAILERGVARGELRPDLDLELALDQLVGPIHHRLLVTGERADRAFVDRLVDQFMTGARP